MCGHAGAGWAHPGRGRRCTAEAVHCPPQGPKRRGAARPGAHASTCPPPQPCSSLPTLQQLELTYAQAHDEAPADERGQVLRHAVEYGSQHEAEAAQEDTQLAAAGARQVAAQQAGEAGGQVDGGGEELQHLVVEPACRQGLGRGAAAWCVSRGWVWWGGVRRVRRCVCKQCSGRRTRVRGAGACWLQAGGPAHSTGC